MKTTQTAAALLRRCAKKSSRHARSTAIRAISASQIRHQSSSTFVKSLLSDSLTNAKEVSQYLATYSNVDKQQFAVIKVGGGVLDNELDDLVESLAFLRSAGLFPVVVHGAGPQLNKRLGDQGIVSDYINGIRITTPEILTVAKQVFQEQNLKLVQALEERGVRARPVQAGVFEAVQTDAKQGLGLVGDISVVHEDPVTSAIAAGCLPVLTCMASTRDGTMLNVNADIAARELAKTMQPLKVVYISFKGGILDNHDRLIPNIDLITDYEPLMNAPWFKHGDKLKLRECKNVLDHLPASSSVAITSARLLRQELFTHKGSGTFIQRRERIHAFDSLEDIDRARLTVLLEDSFGGKLQDDYLDSVKDKIHKIYLSQEYRAVAIITKADDDSSGGVSYLDKFAVCTRHQSEGIGNRLWTAIEKDVPALFWRAKTSNAINSWYFTRAQGTFADPHSPWTVFWYGVDKLSQADQLVQTALAQPVTMNYEHTLSGANQTDVKENRFKVGIIGARGHTGIEIMKILEKHPQAELALASSRALAGKRVDQIHRDLVTDVRYCAIQPEELAERHTECDVWVLAMPNGVAPRFAKHFPPQAKVIDLGSDFRFDPLVSLNSAADADDSSQENVEMDMAAQWVYGLPERAGARQVIANATRIANPGCYATGMQTSLFPLMDRQFLEKRGIDFRVKGRPHVFGISGYSGAGTTPSRKNDPDELRDNLMPYSLTQHTHEKEVSYQLSSLGFTDGVNFSPHVAPWFKGISLTTSIDFDSDSVIDKTAILELFEAYYQNEPLIQVQGDIPEVRDIVGTHAVCLGGFEIDQERQRLVVCATLDNTLKGAASQCIQNINLMCHLNEFEGLE